MNSKSLQTSGTGWAAIIAIAGTVMKQLFDGDPSTNPDWNYVIPGIITAIGVVRSRPKNMTSEEAHAKDKAMPDSAS